MWCGIRARPLHRIADDLPDRRDTRMWLRQSDLQQRLRTAACPRSAGAHGNVPMMSGASRLYVWPSVLVLGLATLGCGSTRSATDASQGGSDGGAGTGGSGGRSDGTGGAGGRGSGGAGGGGAISGTGGTGTGGSGTGGNGTGGNGAGANGSGGAASGGSGGASDCGATCTGGKLCVHPSCGGGTFICEPLGDGGQCPVGWTLHSPCPFASGPAPGCVPPPCTPPPPFCITPPAACATSPSCGCLPSDVCQGGGQCAIINGGQVICLFA